MKNILIKTCLILLAFGLYAALAPSQLVVSVVEPAEGQTTYNLQVIFKRGTPDTSLYYWGAAIAGVGDVNGDGCDDVAIGAYKFVDGEKDTAKIFIYYGKPGGIDTIPALLLSDWSYGTNNLHICGGDINNNGFSDVIICTAGKIYIHYGSATGPSNIPDVVFGGRLNESYTDAATGDLNGDDTTDVIVGDFWRPSGNGHVLVFRGSAAFDTIPWLRINGHDLEQLGASLDASGDVNGDGYTDLAVGAATYNVDSRGRVYIFHGGPAMDTIPDWWKDGEGPGQYWGEMGCAVCPDSAGYAKMWLGSMYYPGGYGSPRENGKTELFYGGISMDSIPDLSIIGSDTFSGLGVTIASSKIDYGVRGDMICGAYEDSARGMGRVWTSRIAQDSVVNGWGKGRWYRDQLGVNTANAGDVNGDSREEVIFASYADTNRLVVICKYTGPEGIANKPFETFDSPGLKLFQNSPNPFRQFTMINYQLSSVGKIDLSVYNIAGQVVRTLVSGRQAAGQHGVTWDGRNNHGMRVCGGVYLCRLSHGDASAVKKIVLLR